METNTQATNRVVTAFHYRNPITCFIIPCHWFRCALIGSRTEIGLTELSFGTSNAVVIHTETTPDETAIVTAVRDGDE